MNTTRNQSARLWLSWWRYSDPPCAAGGEGREIRPEISGQSWLKPALILSSLRKSTLSSFWTFGVTTARNVERSNFWAEKYADKGLTFIAVHIPEFSHDAQVEMFTRRKKNYIPSTPIR